MVSNETKENFILLPFGLLVGYSSMLPGAGVGQVFLGFLLKELKIDSFTDLQKK